jgi:hypothetical protein
MATFKYGGDHPFGDHRRGHRRIRRQQLPDPRSNPSTSDPPGARRYFDGPSAASAAFTVFRAAPITRAISEIAKSSARRNRRISRRAYLRRPCRNPARPPP